MAISFLLSVTGLAQQHLPANNTSGRQVARITSFKLERPNLVVRGSYLSRVEICGVPSGTEIRGDECDPLGDAHRTTDAGKNERWVRSLSPIPIDGWSVTEVYARAYYAHGRPVGSKSLPYSGVSEVNDALWPPADPKVFSHQKEIGLADSGKHFVFADNDWNFSIVLDAAKYPDTAFILDCLPKYDTGQVMGQMTKQIQASYGLPVATFYTSRPGTCTIKNGDFAITVEVLHGNWRL